MLTRVEIRNAQGVLLKLPVYDLSEGYLIKGIEGLDPVKATIVATNFASLDGTQDQAVRRESRTITIKLGYEPAAASTTVSALRNRLYQSVMPKSPVSLRFVDETGDYFDIEGRVETLDSPIFTREPEATISIFCYNPDFYNPVRTKISGHSTSGPTGILIPYEGTVNTGFVFELRPNRPITAMTIYHRPPDNALRSLEFIAPLVSGDVLRISTESGNKYATLIRSNSSSSIVYGVSPFSSWLTLEPGGNEIRVFMGGAAVPFSLEYTEKFGGL